MKKILASVLAVTTLAVAAPALADRGRDDYGRHDRYAYGYAPGYGYDRRDDHWRWSENLQQRQDRLYQRIDNGMRQGKITRGEGRTLVGELNRIEGLERQYARHGFNHNERADLENRLARLADRIRWEKRDDDRYGRGDRHDGDGHRGYRY